MHRFDPKARKSRDFNKHFTSAYLQYMAEIEGEDSTNSEDELGDAFATLLLNATDKDTPLGDTPHSSNSKTFFTLIEGFLTKSAVPYSETLVDSLNNQALMHQLTTRLPSEPKDNLTNNFTTRDTSKYNSYHFYRVVINTGASKYSIAGYKQF
jgi:hypothetical protein